jgi:hypothetical protein
VWGAAFFVFMKARQRIHAKFRAKQRYNIDLKDEEYDALCRQIQNKKSWFIERKSKRKTIHELVLQQKVVRVMYDNRRQTIATFLPR